MLFVILVSLVFVVSFCGLFFVDSAANNRLLPRLLESLFFSSLITLFSTGALIIVMLIASFALAEGKSETTRSTERIVSLKDNVQSEGELSGTFFLLAGSAQGKVGPTLAYSWYEENDRGAYEQRTVVDGGEDEKGRPVKVEIIETSEDQQPEAIRTLERNWVETPSWLFPFNIEEDFESDDHVRWELHVPEGTIAHSFELDSE